MPKLWKFTKTYEQTNSTDDVSYFLGKLWYSLKKLQVSESKVILEDVHHPPQASFPSQP